MSKANVQVNVINGIDVTELKQTIAGIAEQPELGAACFRAESRWIDGRRVSNKANTFSACGVSHTRPMTHEVTTDVPESLLGQDTGQSPLELALSALGACVATTLAVEAAAQGLPIEALRVEVCGDIDLRGFMNLAPIRAGFTSLSIGVDIDTGLSQEQRRVFVESALRHSPVLDLFDNGAAISTRVR